MKFRIIDAHVHIGRGQLLTDPLLSNISPDAVLRLMEEAAVGRAIIFAPYCPGGYGEANKEIAGYVTDHPDRFIGFGRIRAKVPAHGVRSLWRRGAGKLSRTLAAMGTARHGVRGVSTPLPEDLSTSSKECQEEVGRCFEQYKFSGIKIHPVQDGLPSHAVLGIIQEFRKPILFHGGAGVDLPVLEEHVIKRYTMPIILAHMGGYPADRSLYTEALALAARYPHLYLDTSYVFFQYVLERALATCPSKIVFGSDAPGIHPGTSITCIRSLRVPEDVKQMVFADNIGVILET
jgi:uncharacterized protein